MKRDAIERSLALIAVAGAALFVSLVGALAFVQVGLTSSQATLAEVVVPTQAEMADLTAGLGALFRRQSQATSTQTAAQLTPLRDRAAIERSLTGATTNLERLLGDGALRAHPHHPGPAVASLRPRLEALLASDQALFESLERRHQLQEQLEEQLRAVDAERRELMESSFGVAGVLRLDYVLLLRRLAGQVQAGSPLLEDVRKSVYGAERAQLDAMGQLDAAVLQLGVLGGKVGLAADPDALNSLVANELPQNRSAITRALAVFSAHEGDPALAARVQTLSARCDALTRHIGDETHPGSLVLIKRQLFRESATAAETRAEAITSAAALQQVHEALEGFSRVLRDEASAHAHTTVVLSRAVSGVLSLVGLAVVLFAGLRLRRSAEGLRERNAMLKDLSENLEKKVDERTEALHRRERAMQLVLDSTGDGLVSVALDGTFLPERSRAMSQWFGPHVEGQRLWELFFADDPRKAASFELGFAQLVEDLLPFEVSADQLPRRCRREGRTFELEFKQVIESGRFARVLVLVRDVTARLEAERGELLTRELQALVGFLLRDRAGFTQLVADCEAKLAEISAGVDEQTARRLLHTVKGNTAVGGFLSVAALVHELETAMDDEGRGPTVDERNALQTAWKASLARIEEYVSGDARERVELNEEELAELEQLLDRRADYGELLALVRSWRDEPAALVLSRLAAQARRIAPQLGRQVDVELRANGLRLPPERWAPFWSASIHLVRNAMDHGLELPEVRRALGKPLAGKLVLETVTMGDRLLFTVEDDGAGINWDALRESALRRGLPAESRADLLEALFADGVSSRAAATELSGRGVGLAAVRAAARSLGGDVTVESTSGRGTRFVFSFPCERCQRAAAA